MITVKEALERILKTIVPLGTEKTDILGALGRVIGEDIYALRNIPPQNNSAMDGYALKSEDVRDADAEHPVVLNIVEDIPAGYAPQKTVGHGEAARIMTGAPIPDGADAVVMVEETRSDGDSVRIYGGAEKSQHIRYAGEDVHEGDLVIRAGTLLRPAEVGMLSALGRSFVQVYQRPRVALIATGNELVDIDGAWLPGRIVSSNNYSLAAQVIECGGIPLQLGIAKDTKYDLAEKFKDAIRADIIVSSAGVSVGDYDFVKEVMNDMSIGIEFWQVAQRPGKPMTFGTREGKPFFGLPGNPVSSMVAFEQYVRPAILRMTGHEHIFRRTIKAKLTEDIQKKKGLRYFLRARVKIQGKEFVVETAGDQGSGILKSMALANGIMVLPEDTDFIKAGSDVLIQLLDNSYNFTKHPEYLND